MPEIIKALQDAGYTVENNFGTAVDIYWVQ